MTQDLSKGNALIQIRESEGFKAQIALEDEIYAREAQKLLTLDLKVDSLSLEYAEVRGRLNGLKQLKAARDTLIRSTVEKLRESL